MSNLEVIAVREEFGLSQQKFADLVGVDRRSVVNWENGKVVPMSKVKLFQFLLEKKRNEVANDTPQKEVSLSAMQTIENLNREIHELKEHIKTLRDLVDEKTNVTELYKNENARMKGVIESFNKD